MLELLKTPLTLEQSLRLIMFIFVAGFAPIWVVWSKRFLDRVPLQDAFNSIITASFVTLFVVSDTLYLRITIVIHEYLLSWRIHQHYG